MLELSLFEKIAVSAIPVLFAITLHEVAHGWVANLLGDSTAKMLGRLTLNPLKHIDLVGTIIVPAILLYMGGFVFGWAKPVPINWRNLKHPYRDMALVSAAGPLSNFLMACFWALFYHVAAALEHSSYTLALLTMSQIGVLVNCILMVLNLIPIPPLDGSRVLSALLPKSMAYYYNRLEPFGFVILMLLFYVGILSTLMDPFVYYFMNLLL